MCAIQIVALLRCASAVFAVVAAVLWFKSAKVKTPSSFPVNVVQGDSFSQPFAQPLGGTFVGQGYSPALNELGEALRRQSKWSAWAAGFAAVSALFQALTMLFESAK